jgi:hypothetical protein
MKIISNVEPCAILEIPTTSFDSEADLADYLVASAQSASHPHLYRGQSREHRRRWPLTAGPFRRLSAEDLIDLRSWRFEPATVQLPIPLLPGTLDLPSLIPTNTRVYEQSLSGVAPVAQEDAFDEMMVYFWTSVCAFLVGLACVIRRDAAAATWFGNQWTSNCPHLDKLRSIGQHYGMDTGLLDATSSIAVALWFATHDFKSGAYRSRESGVIYRIRPAQLERAQEWLEALPEHEGQFDARMIDLGDTPESIAPRAVRQQGWSLVGWEHPRLVIKMVTGGGLERFVFPIGPAPCPLNSLTREWLVPHPQQDPVRALFEIFWTYQPGSLRQAQEWIDRYWNIGGGPRIQLDGSGSWFGRLASEFGWILDYYEHALRDRFFEHV